MISEFRDLTIDAIEELWAASEPVAGSAVTVQSRRDYGLGWEAHSVTDEYIREISVLPNHYSDEGLVTVIFEGTNVPTIVAVCSHESGNVAWLHPSDEIEISVRWKNGQPVFSVKRC